MQWTDDTGKRRAKLLPGEFGSEESWEAYRRACAEIGVSGVVTDFDAPASKEAVAACRMVVATLMKVATTDMPQLDVDEALDAVLRRCELVVAQEEKRVPVYEGSAAQAECVMDHLRIKETSKAIIKGILAKKFGLRDEGDSLLQAMISAGKIACETRMVKQGKRTVATTYYKLSNQQE